MPNLNVTYSDMRDASSRLRSGQSELESKLQELKSMIDNLVSSGYVTDKSSVAFQSAYTEFNDGASKTIQGLEGISAYLDKAAEALESTDSELASAIGK
ncbi:WXG100 family type VII secretion target [Brachybacterium halotolerans subsp. kimchii]|uniref:WXG100 family type VII secretion target n=1 Tax=Brachybacterium TaxID=43668 RepID=UPI0012663D20|nr:MULTISPECIES: WXG100 family type VII secretion target [Brachybacterium]UEJ82161.1 WXG100 family type VII secretion target [Brachybacterium halotolerans subsp. kimchii]